MSGHDKEASSPPESTDPGPHPSSDVAGALVVLISGVFHAAFEAVIGDFETRSGCTVRSELSPSMGDSDSSVENRLSRGEDADVLIMAGGGMDDIAAGRMILDGSRVELARAPVGLAMRAGEARPDISTPDKLRDVLLSASSVGYSISASGRYVSGHLFETLGIVEQMKAKAHQVTRLVPVAETVARGENQYGFQAVSEILPVQGAELVGRLPEKLEFVTPVSAAIARHSRRPGLAGTLLAFLTRLEMRAVLERHGLETAGTR